MTNIFEFVKFYCESYAWRLIANIQTLDKNSLYILEVM